MTKENNLLKVNDSQKRSLAIATIVALFIAFVFLKKYLMLIAVAAIFAFIFFPVYKWLISKGLKSGTATTLTFLATMLTIIIPLVFVIIVTVSQVNHLITSASSGSLNIDFGQLGSRLIENFNDMMSQWGLNFRLSASEITSWMSSVINKFGNQFISWVANSVTGVFSLITYLIIYIYVFFSLLKNHKSIIETTAALNPLGEKITDVYLSRMGSMTKAMVRGQFIIAFCQGLASAIGLYIAGFHGLFFFFLLTLTVMSIIPLGAGIITIPLGIVMILFGDVWQGVLVIANHLLIVTNIDNVLRPSLVPKDARLDPALTMLSVFAGLAMFGFFGIVLGPVLMIVIITTIQMFLEVYRNIDALDNKGGKSRSIWSFFSKLNPAAKK
ncbi:AI-2E family transporter [Candidatus Saccharibacteria bacterium]|nr:AI-2E family transporter [Candidatus Saccharibacteria bacterium]